MAGAISLSHEHGHMTHTLALMQAAGPAGGLGSMGPFLFQLVAIFAIFYFLMIRPQQKQKQRHEQALRELRKGDEIVTAGGIIGEVIHIKESVKDGEPSTTMEDRVTIKSGESRLVIERGRIAKVVSRIADATPAA